ncbi:tetratricopeptide repeat protein [Desulfolutivibrio sulfoxidireducens]|uniref:tetratricopeptide repeat protein n=1 Tax=Desulfolutivibrio sulfoxidireducens TaxID=2773299 RepID=UPI00159DE112|nr:tetratricopeptide repeat protein [Desulfolutivibrio sulfoxidireducens]QLA16060.1 tetratricopeptide repeat protein [Desulfolutivibrio sulfoxidireducens]
MIWNRRAFRFVAPVTGVPVVGMVLLAVFFFGSNRPCLANGLSEAKSAVAAEKQGNYPAAVECYARALAATDLSESSKALVHAARGDLLASLDRPHEAMKDYNAALALVPGNAAVYFNRGNLLFAMGRYDDAIADYTRAIELDATDAGAFNNRGTAWFTKGNLESALANYTKAMELLPDDAQFVNNRGRVWLKKGDAQRARADFSMAKSLNPNIRTPLD